MAKMKAAMAAVLVMEKEGITQAFGVPGGGVVRVRMIDGAIDVSVG